MTEPDERPGSDDPEDPSELQRLIGRTVPRSPHADARRSVGDPASPGSADDSAADPVVQPADGPSAAGSHADEARPDAGPADDAADDVPAEEAQAGGAPAERTPAGGAPAEETPAGGVSADEIPSDEASSGESPIDGVPAGTPAPPTRDVPRGTLVGARAPEVPLGTGSGAGTGQPRLDGPGSDRSGSNGAGAQDATPGASGDEASGREPRADDVPGGTLVGAGAPEVPPGTVPERAESGEPGEPGEPRAEDVPGGTLVGARAPKVPLGADSGGAGADEPGADEPGAAEPGATEPGATEPGSAEPDATEPGADAPRIDEEPIDPVDELADDTDLENALEALLLVVDSPVDEASLATTLDQPTSRIRATLHRMSVAYTADARGIDLRRAGGGWRFYTRDRYAPYVEKMLLDGQRARLTRAALETLAVVAYRQPVTRARVSAVRGVNCDGVLRTLLTRGLVEEAGAEEQTGGTLFRTTELFLERLGLSSVAELPPLAPLLPDIDAIDDLDGS